MTTKRECFDRVVAELHLDTRDPFTNLLANACALADLTDELRAALAAAQKDVDENRKLAADMAAARITDSADAQYFRWLVKHHSGTAKDKNGTPRCWIGGVEFLGTDIRDAIDDELAKEPR